MASTGSTASVNYLRGPFLYLTKDFAPELLDVNSNVDALQLQLLADLENAEESMDFRSRSG